MPPLFKKHSDRHLIALLILILLTLLAAPQNTANAAEVEMISVLEARQKTVDGEMLLIDIRQPDEWKSSGIPDVAIELDMKDDKFLPSLMALMKENPDKRIGVICAVGSRSRYLANWLSQRGIKNVVNVFAGVHGRNGWLANKLPVRRPD